MIHPAAGRARQPVGAGAWRLSPPQHDTGRADLNTASVRELLRGLSADAEWLLTAASVFREPVACDALPGGTGGRSGRSGPAGLSELIGRCAAAGLMTVDRASQPPDVRVGAQIAAELHAHLARADRRGAIARAHRHAANYWQWRVAALAEDWQSHVHDLLEARHHLIEAEDLDLAETITEDICSRLHAFGAFEQERALLGDTLARVPADSPRRAAWAYRLGKACHLQGDHEEAEHWFRQALAGFTSIADSRGMARCHGYLGALAHARGDFADAERCYLKAHALESSPAPAEAGRPAPATDQPESQRRRGTNLPAADARPGRRLARSIAARARRRRVLAAAAAAAAVLAFGAALAAASAQHRGAAGAGAVQTAAPAQHRGAAGAGSALAAAAAARDEAAAWIARWGANDAIVACDPLMCSALQSRGLPAARILQITSSTADPLGSDLVAATAAIRGRFGGRLGAVYAPDVIASFGSGSIRVDVRVVAPNGAVAYRRALRADLAARRLAGSVLLGNPRIWASAAAARQLTAGRVDSRLLITLAALATLRPVAVIAFGGSGPGSSATMPLLNADITAGTARAGGPVATGPAAARSLAGMVAFLRAQRAPLLAASISELRAAAGPRIVRIRFAAPSPLGLVINTASVRPGQLPGGLITYGSSFIRSEKRRS